jgi:hypothetical protein
MAKKQAQPQYGYLFDEFPVTKRKLKRWLCLIIGVILVSLSVVLILGLIMLSTQIIVNYGRATLLKFLPYYFMVIFIFFPLGIFFILLSRAVDKKGVYLYEKGLIINRGFSERNMLWEEVEKLDTRFVNIEFGNSIIGEKQRIILQGHNNRRLVIRKHFKHFRELANQIRQIVLPILYQRASQCFAENGFISFHKDLIATRKGLYNRVALGLWQNIVKYEINKGYLVFSFKPPQKAKFQTKVAEINNLDLLLLLVDKFK